MCPLNRGNIQNLEILTEDKLLAWYRTTSWALQSSCSCLLPNFHCILAHDELRLSSLLTQLIPRSIHWCSSHAFCRSPNNSTFVGGSSRLSQWTKNLRLEDCGTQTLSFQVGSRYLAQVSTCPETDCHLLVTLEKNARWLQSRANFHVLSVT